MRVCSECRHRRQKREPQLFGRLANPAILETKLKWVEHQRKMAALEDQMVSGGQDFDFEPIAYDWCERWTELDDRSVVDPVSGKSKRIYALCVYKNGDGECGEWEARDRD